jgi:hypothetical protein
MKISCLAAWICFYKWKESWAHAWLHSLLSWFILYICWARAHSTHLPRCLPARLSHWAPSRLLAHGFLQVLCARSLEPCALACPSHDWGAVWPLGLGEKEASGGSNVVHISASASSALQLPVLVLEAQTPLCHSCFPQPGTGLAQVLSSIFIHTYICIYTHPYTYHIYVHIFTYMSHIHTEVWFFSVEMHCTWPHYCCVPCPIVACDTCL